MKLKIIFIAFIGFFVFGIQSTTAQTSDDKAKIERLLEKKREYNKRHGYGFRIQLYNGLEKRAKSIKSRFEIEFPSSYTKLDYDEPEWKVQVGNYKTRLEADKALNRIREKFSGAIVIPIGS